MKNWLETRWKVDAYPWIRGNPLFVIRLRRAHGGKASRHREFIALSSVENSKILRDDSRILSLSARPSFTPLPP